MAQTEQIAIDGPAASGKSTVARLLADEVDAYFVNTGDMYRALTWYVMSQDVEPRSQPEKVPSLLDDLDLSCHPNAAHQLRVHIGGDEVPQAEIRAPKVTSAVSFLARIPAVRAWLIDKQRQLAELGLIVTEGRDMGTIVFPQARFKFFVTATPEERARRRLLQDGEIVDGATLASVAAEIAERDRLDSTRKIAPLRPADDAVIVDTTGRTVEEIVAELAATVREGLGCASQESPTPPPHTQI
jgi:cytidylate kinase